MSSQDEIRKVLYGTLSAIAPQTIADEIGKVVSNLVGEKYSCVVRSITYDSFNAKLDIELHKEFEFDFCE